MIHSLYCAWRYVAYNRAKTAVLVASITLIGFLPMALEVLLGECERQLLARAASTPLVVGGKGSSLDLVLSTLYFGEQRPEPIMMAAVHRIERTELALPIPVYVRFRARGLPVIGTTLDYFEFRDLGVARGRRLASLGECLLGDKAARALGLGPGDTLVTSSEDPFNLAGVYPLELQIVGVLTDAHTPDDEAVFVDLKTAWIIQGLGHGHEDVRRLHDPTLVLERTGSNVAATAKLLHYRTITEKNAASFHFHGEQEAYPITAVLAVPDSARSGTLLRGKYVGNDERHQIVVPGEVIDGLLEEIFRIKRVLDAVVAVVAAAMVLVVCLVFVLSLRLRAREVRTVFMIGGTRMAMASILAAEVLLILALSAVLCTLLIIGMHGLGESVVRAWIIG